MTPLAPSAIEAAAAALFAVAVLHTFSTRLFARLAHTRSNHAGLWHLLSEVEVVFGLWALLLVLLLFGSLGKSAAIDYLHGRDFKEPMFVFAIMVIAASRPILELVRDTVIVLARSLPLEPAVAFYFLTLALIPLFGSFITEPAAMTLAALMLRDRFLRGHLPLTLKYATVGALFVNVSIGGVLTPYAAPPVLMVAGTWGWDFPFMLQTFGWRAALAVFANAALLTWLFRDALRDPRRNLTGESRAPVPWQVRAVHVGFLAAVVAFAHYPSVFMALFLFFLGFAEAYDRYQDRLILREGLLVAFFLAGLITLGGYQRWWLEELLADLSPQAMFWGATALTAITDNAALTYLGSLVEGISDASKYALVAGAVTGGGLTVIANAPNPAGLAILKSCFADETVNPLWLLLAALVPTVIAAGMFLL